jgi:kanamycin kinase/aminoglycoside 3'-phosphotransferase-2
MEELGYVISLPDDLLPHTGTVHHIEQPAQGCNFEVYLIHAEAGKFILKCTRESWKKAELEAESQVLAHLEFGNPATARFVAKAAEDDLALYLFTYLEGTTVCDAVESGDEAHKHALVADYARTLRRIHAWTPNLPKHSNWTSDTLTRALEALASGYEPDGFVRYGPLAALPPGERPSAMMQWSEGLRTELVFGHGDYCLPNVLLEDGVVTGVIDWSRGGYQDRRFDLATACLTIRHNLRDEAFVTTFLEAYGYTQPKATLWLFEALYVLI